WVIVRRSRAPIAPAHRRQVKPVNHLNDEPRQMSLRKPVIHRRRQKEASLAVNRAEIAQKRATQRGRKAESMQRFYPTSPCRRGLMHETCITRSLAGVKSRLNLAHRPDESRAVDHFK